MTDLGLGKTCMKYILFAVNFCFFVLGGVAFGVGIWAKADNNKMAVLSKVGAENSDFNISGLLDSAAIVLIIGGAAVLLLGFFGCWGAYKENQCLLCLYAIVLLVIVILQIVVVVIAGMFKGQVSDEVKSFIKKNINTTYEGRIDTSEQFSLGLDYAQVYFHCCGVDSYTDFDSATKWNRTFNTGAEMMVPPSCCKIKNEEDFFENPADAQLEDPMCPVNPNDANSHWKQPCWDSIHDYFNSRGSVLLGIAIGIVVAEVLCFIFACCIISTIRKQSEYV